MTTLTIRVVAAVIADGNRLLVCQRPPHKRHGGLWEFPGGKCESGESDADATRRELAEELGVRVVSVENALLEASDPNSAFVIAFVPAVIEGEPQCLEHSAIGWKTLDELHTLPLAPSDRCFVDFMSTQR